MHAAASQRSECLITHVQSCRRDGFGTAVAIRASIERLRPAIKGHHAAIYTKRQQNDLHARCKRPRALGSANGGRAVVHRHKRRRARRIDACNGSTQVESKRQTTRCHMWLLARRTVCRRSLQCCLRCSQRLHQLPVHVLNGDEQADITASKCGALLAGAMQRRIAHLEHQPLLWVHVIGLRR